MYPYPYYLYCWSSLKDMLLKEFKLILISLGIFLCSFLFGFIYAYTLLGNHSFSIISELHTPFHDDTIKLLDIILISNLKLLFLLIIPTFGFHTILNLFYNGISNGIILGTSIRKFSDATFVLLLIIPHGIFEIPAIIIAGAAGFKIPYEIIRYLAGKKEQPLTKEDIKEYLTLALISIILIVIAAFVEAYITLKIAKAMLNSTKGV